MENSSSKKTEITMKRINGFSYKSSDGKWLICHEGSRTWWYACELDADGFTDEYTKQYFRSYKEAKTYVMDQSTQSI